MTTLSIAAAQAAVTPRDVLVIDEERTFAESLAMALTGPALGGWEVSALTTAEALRATGAGVPPARLIVVGGRRAVQRQLLSLLGISRPEAALVVLLDSVDEVDELPLLARLGARGWACRNDSLEHVGRVVRDVSAGGWWLPRWAVGEALDSLRQSVDDRTAASFASLTPRERQVLQGLIEGLPRAAIAHRHRMSINTVRTHVQHLFEKLGVHSCLEAVVLAQHRSGPDLDR